MNSSSSKLSTIPFSLHLSDPKMGVWKSGKPESGIGTGIGTGTGSGTGMGTGMGRETYI